MDFPLYLGHPAEDAVARLTEALGESPRSTERTGAYVDYAYFSFRASGCSLQVNPFDLVSCVFIYPVAHSGFQPFTHPLPHGLAATTTQDAARAHLGPPARSGGPVRTLSGAPVSYWDLWAFGSYELHLQYSEARDGIYLLTIQEPS